MLRMLLTGFCVIGYAFLWYEGTMLPAWQTLIWVALVFLYSLDDYLQEKMDKIAKSLP